MSNGILQGAALAESVAGTTGSAGSAQHAKLKRAAHEFESMMLEELMKPLNKTSSVDDANNADEDGGPLQSFGTQAMASALAQSGALGFANRLVNSLEARRAHADAKSPAHTRA